MNLICANATGRITISGGVCFLCSEEDGLDKEVAHNNIEEEYWGTHSPLSQLNRKVRRRSRGKK